MKIVVVCLLVIFAVLPAYCWTGIEQYDPNNNHTGHCFGHDLGEMEENEVRNLIGRCAIARCKSNRDISLTGCIKQIAEPPCYLVDGDLSLPYPKCCKQVRCVDENSLENPQNHE